MASHFKTTMDHLDTSPIKCLEEFNLHSDVKVDMLTVGAAILRDGNDGKEVLLLQRLHSRKAYPCHYELPSSRPGQYYTTVQVFIDSEVHKKTNLRVRNVVRPLSAFTHRTGASDGPDNAVQLNYVVNVYQGGVCMYNIFENADACWADKKTLDVLTITAEMKGVAMEALGSA